MLMLPEDNMREVIERTRIGNAWSPFGLDGSSAEFTLVGVAGMVLYNQNRASHHISLAPAVDVLHKAKT
jgi:hypothetical protein